MADDVTLSWPLWCQQIPTLLKLWICTINLQPWADIAFLYRAKTILQNDEFNRSNFSRTPRPKKDKAEKEREKAEKDKEKAEKAAAKQAAKEAAKEEKAKQAAEKKVKFVPKPKSSKKKKWVAFMIVPLSIVADMCWCLFIGID